MKKLYLAVDGDNVGSRLEYYVLINDTDTLTAFSNIFNSTMKWFENQLVTNFEATIIFYGGDNLLACINAEKYSAKYLEKLKSKFAEKTKSTLSIGLGESPQKAYFALKYAKTSGKNSIRYFEEFADG